MYLASIDIENFRCFGEKERAFHLNLRPGLTALVGENDVGKSAVIDALRMVFGTTDQEICRLEAHDFHAASSEREIRISLHLVGLSDGEKQAFAEYLTYDFADNGTPSLWVNWIAKDLGEHKPRRSGIRIEVRSGSGGKGPTLAQEARDLLRVTYLRPLRDADRSLSAGRNSRLAQILGSTPTIETEGTAFSAGCDLKQLDLATLSVLGIGDLANELLKRQKAVVDARGAIDGHLGSLAIGDDPLKSKIVVGGATLSNEMRLRQLLEKLDLALGGDGRLGLGSNNLLFMACELLLLAQDDDGNRLLLIEEPEAHLHAQRQLYSRA